MAALWLAASRATAQDAAATTDDDPPTSLDRLVVRPEREEVLDLYPFQNPVDVPPTAFERRWKEPPSLEQLGKNGGIVPVLAGLAGKGIQTAARKIPGWKEPMQTVIARPPPLDEEQAARALRLHDTTGDSP